MPNSQNEKNVCTWCRSEAGAEKPIVVAPNKGASICQSCNDLVAECFNESKAESSESSEPSKLPTPKELLAVLDQHIIGQNIPKRRVSLAVYNHYKRLNQSGGASTFKKSNLLLMGPTGSGKTLVAETLAKTIDVPFVIADANSLTASGYVGNDVESILSNLIQKANGDLDRAERGIVFLDEIDKICKKSENPSITRDVSGEDVQQALLKIIEGSEVDVPKGSGSRRHPNAPTEKIDTRNILFICAGAFSQLENIVEQKSSSSGIGFTAGVEKGEESSLIDYKVTSEDLVKCGLIPELIGRLPVVTSFNPLDAEALLKIMSEPHNSILDQFTELLSFDDVGVSFTHEYCEAVANLAFEKETGARGLRAIIEDSLQDLLFEAPDYGGHHVQVNAEIIDNPSNFTLLKQAA